MLFLAPRKQASWGPGGAWAPQGPFCHHPGQVMPCLEEIWSCFYAVAMNPVIFKSLLHHNHLFRLILYKTGRATERFELSEHELVTEALLSFHSLVSSSWWHCNNSCARAMTLKTIHSTTAKTAPGKLLRHFTLHKTITKNNREMLHEQPIM